MTMDKTRVETQDGSKVRWLVRTLHRCQRILLNAIQWWRCDWYRANARQTNELPHPIDHVRKSTFNRGSSHWLTLYHLLWNPPMPFSLNSPHTRQVRSHRDLNGHIRFSFELTRWGIQDLKPTRNWNGGQHCQESGAKPKIWTAASFPHKLSQSCNTVEYLTNFYKVPWLPHAGWNSVGVVQVGGHWASGFTLNLVLSNAISLTS